MVAWAYSGVDMGVDTAGVVVCCCRRMAHRSLRLDESYRMSVLLPGLNNCATRAGRGMAQRLQGRNLLNIGRVGRKLGRRAVLEQGNTAAKRHRQSGHPVGEIRAPQEPAILARFGRFCPAAVASNPIPMPRS